MRHFWIPLLLAVSSSARAETPTDLCRLLQEHLPAKDLLTTFVVIGAAPHGYFATSSSCPKRTSPIEFVLGHGPRARNFYRWAFSTPLLMSGIREIQATVDYSDKELVVKRVHAYRELPEAEAMPFQLRRSPKDEAILNEAAAKAATDADAAAKR